MAWLVKNGLTLREVEEMDETEQFAWSVCFSESEGASFDFDRWQWNERK
jgi:hypothetical protein